MKSIETVRVPVEPTQQDNLRTLFASPGWLILREILSAHCVESQAAFLDASMYESENASDKATSAKDAAVRFNTALDVLDGIQGNVDEWFRIMIEQRR